MTIMMDEQLVSPDDVLRQARVAHGRTMAFHFGTFRSSHARASMNRIQFEDSSRLDIPGDAEPAAAEGRQLSAAAASDIEQQMRKCLRLASSRSPFYTAESLAASRSVSRCDSPSPMLEGESSSGNGSSGNGSSGNEAGPASFVRSRSRGRRSPGPDAAEPDLHSSSMHTHMTHEDPDEPEEDSTREGLAGCRTKSNKFMVAPFPTRFMAMDALPPAADEPGPSPTAASGRRLLVAAAWEQPQPQPQPQPQSQRFALEIQGQGQGQAHGASATARRGRGRPRRMSAPDAALLPRLLSAVPGECLPGLASPLHVSDRLGQLLAAEQDERGSGGAASHARPQALPRRRSIDTGAMGAGAGGHGLRAADPGADGYGYGCDEEDDADCDAFADLGSPTRSAHSATGTQQTAAAAAAAAAALQRRASGGAALRPSSLSIGPQQLQSHTGRPGPHAQLIEPYSPGCAAAPPASPSGYSPFASASPHSGALTPRRSFQTQRRASCQLGIAVGPAGSPHAGGPGSAAAPGSAEAAHALLTQVCRAPLRQARPQEWTVEPALVCPPGSHAAPGSTFRSGVGWVVAPAAAPAAPVAAPGSPSLAGAGHSPSGRFGGRGDARVHFAGAGGGRGSPRGGGCMSSWPGSAAVPDAQQDADGASATQPPASNDGSESSSSSSAAAAADLSALGADGCQQPDTDGSFSPLTLPRLSSQTDSAAATHSLGSPHRQLPPMSSTSPGAPPAGALQGLPRRPVLGSGPGLGASGPLGQQGQGAAAAAAAARREFGPGAGVSLAQKIGGGGGAEERAALGGMAERAAERAARLQRRWSPL